MRNAIQSLVFITLLLAAPVFADSIGIGNISILADNPTGGVQELTINNLTGFSCGLGYAACTNLDFTDWTLTVNYTSSYYNGSGPIEPTPFVFTDSGSGLYGGFGDITPSSTNNIFDFDLCGGAGSCPDGPVTTITSVEFSGQISPASFCLYDPTASGCGNTTFFANPNFDLVWNGSSPQSPYVDETSVYAQSPDITVTNQDIVVSTTPEPGTFFLLTALLPLAEFARRSKRSNSRI
jgi:hypothetical protein